MILKLSLLMLLVIVAVNAQDNAQPRLAPALRICYQNRAIFERDNRLPMTPQMLVELIRKIEDSPGFTLNMRQLATTILFRFKQDGILPFNTGVSGNDFLPFAVNGFNFNKHRVLLTRLIQGNANGYQNGTLTPVEECALHFMLSNSIETHVRNDEGQRCNQLAQLRSFRVPRDVAEDVEMMKTPEMEKVKKRLHSKFGRYENAEDEENVEAQNDDVPVDENIVEDEDNELLDTEAQQDQIDGTNTNTVSQCPVENGVLHNHWGAINAGTVLTGLAAGLAPLNVTVRELVAQDDENHQYGNYKMARQTAGVVVDNRYAATLSGDIAESVLVQAPRNIQVGAAGAWNNTAVPHWYFLSQRDRFEQTDSEIRAGIDGLLLSLRINEWHSNVPSLRLSQVLDMYYSQRGMFGTSAISPDSDTSLRACNRRNMFSTIQMNALIQQSIAFTTVLDGEMTASITLTPNSTLRFATQATQSLQTYIASTMNDLTCASTQTVVGSETIWRTASDIYIYVDTTWPFVQIRAMIGHLLNNLDVGRFGTTYTIMNANDGTVIVRTTNQLSDFYVQWNQTVHDMQPRGLNLANVVRETRGYMQSLMNRERETENAGGRSLINLIVTENAAVNEADSNFAAEQLHIMREEVPDLRWIFWAAGSPNRFDRFVREPARDLYALRIDLQGIGSDSIQTVAFPVIQRIQQEPRRIINHRCGANWAWEWGDVQMTQFVEPRGIVFYRIAPNYFFGDADRQGIRITGAGFSTITVCHSRVVERPRMNTTNNQQQQGEVFCQNVNTDTVEIDLRNQCDTNGLVQWCLPLFISIEGPSTHDGLNLRCVERECRFPDNARFQIFGDNLGCWSGVGSVIASLSLVIVSLIMTIRF